MFWTRPAAMVASVAGVTSKRLISGRVAQIGVRAGITFVLSVTGSNTHSWRWGIISRVVWPILLLWIVCLVSVIVGWRRWESVGGWVELVTLGC